MQPAALFAIFVVVAVAVVAYSVAQASKRRQEAAATASALGLTFRASDDRGLSLLPHPIFRLGDTRRASNLASGEIRGRPVVLFDYEYTDHRTDAEGKRTSSTYRFSCVLVELPIDNPRLVLRRERVTTKLANAFGFGRDIQFESDEFNRSFEVRSDSQEFAFTLIDTAMMEWLLSSAGDLEVQFEPGSMLVVSRRRPWSEMSALARRSLEFTDRFPRLVWATYGSRSA